MEINDADIISYYESAQDLLVTYGDVEQVLDHILHQVVDHKISGNDSQLQDWLNIAFAVHELVGIYNGEVTVH